MLDKNINRVILYLYLIGALILALAGLVVQFKIKRMMDMIKNDGDEEIQEENGVGIRKKKLINRKEIEDED